MLAQKRNTIIYKNMFSNFFFISNWTLDPPTHFQSLFGLLEFFFIYMSPKTGSYSSVFQDLWRNSSIFKAWNSNYQIPVFTGIPGCVQTLKMVGLLRVHVCRWCVLGCMRMNKYVDVRFSASMIRVTFSSTDVCPCSQVSPLIHW